MSTIRVSFAEQDREVALFEGKAQQDQSQLLVAGAVGTSRGESALLLGEAFRALSAEGLKADVAIAWGETAAPALAASTASVRVFVIPSGRVGDDLTEAEVARLGERGFLSGATSEVRLLASLGAASANAIVAPSPSSARSLEKDRGLADRATDEPVVSLRFGCDDYPNDPAHDSSLPSTFSAKVGIGKVECRKALVRRFSLSADPRTLILGTAPLRRSRGGAKLLEALSAIGALDIAVAIPGDGDPDLLDQARRLAIGAPGRWAFLAAGEGEERFLRAASDAILFGDKDDRVGRSTGLAQLYGALPICYEGGAARDYLVDYDPASGTGGALLFGSDEPHEIVAAIGRATRLRANTEGAVSLAEGLMSSAPRWSRC
ncbi:MAG TPA: hypothetical protein VHU40_22785, partial [Polyangia bacterium]|nr:hypothetical protein [Polyangia bacterium]